MNYSKAATTLAIVGLIVSGQASAYAVVANEVPASSIQECVAEIATQANYDAAERVRHVVDTRDWRNVGHKITILTSVFGADSSEAIRAYRTVCAVSDHAELKRFKIQEESS